MIIFTLCSCKSSNNTDVKGKITGARGYSSMAEITVNGNKGVSKYKVKQYILYPDKLRIETLEPYFLKNKVLVRNEGIWKIYHPLINQTLTVSKLMEDDELILMGVFQKSLFDGKDALVADGKFNGEECYSIKTAIPKGNRFRSTAVLYIDTKNNLPIGMEILDSNGEKKIEVRYIDFQYSSRFDASLFVIK